MTDDATYCSFLGRYSRRIARDIRNVPKYDDVAVVHTRLLACATGVWSARNLRKVTCSPRDDATIMQLGVELPSAAQPRTLLVGIRYA
jgi:hypothetical protein